MAWGTWQSAKGVDLALKLPKAQTDVPEMHICYHVSVPAVNSKWSDTYIVLCYWIWALKVLPTTNLIQPFTHIHRSAFFFYDKALFKSNLTHTPSLRNSGFSIWPEDRPEIESAISRLTDDLLSVSATDSILVAQRGRAMLDIWF